MDETNCRVNSTRAHPSPKATHLHVERTYSLERINQLYSCLPILYRSRYETCAGSHARIKPPAMDDSCEKRKTKCAGVRTLREERTVQVSKGSGEPKDIVLLRNLERRKRPPPSSIPEGIVVETTTTSSVVFHFKEPISSPFPQSAFSRMPERPSTSPPRRNRCAVGVPTYVDEQLSPFLYDGAERHSPARMRDTP
ncbi:hypothetical protein KIN20_032002 [Parelaphostrongylus tenuis]|uniref:Uncharacterized protein n=1 Tax=Parelaphostrongylus tenuis TaxID=148309 RepID=A0AAD5R6A2_PARTN|nr:hypothetical protein KIN20_032002 [Parelaphostrongylus tenuis]